MKVIWTELAIEKLEEYADYIALDNQNAALKWTNKIQTSVNRLISFPQLGRVVPEINRKEVREIIDGNYRIVYRIKTKHISVLTIRHMKQLFDVNDIISN